jgi:hypothetical protein
MDKKQRAIEWYQLVFEQMQPLHIGKLNYGVISETEIFIPGQTMWGALTKSYNLLNKEDLSKNQELFSSVTCFFPSFDGIHPLAPSYKNGVLHLGENVSEDEFRFTFVDTVVTTAITPLTRGAIDESLHEIDYLLPRPKNELPEKNIYKENTLKWIGLIGIEKSYSYIHDFLQKDNLLISVGGKIKYGFGQLLLKYINKIDGHNLEVWNLNEQGELCINNVLRNFVQIISDTEFKWDGNIVPIAEFDFTKNVPVIIKASFYISVGSRIYAEKENNPPLNKYRLFKGKFIA